MDAALQRRTVALHNQLRKAISNSSPNSAMSQIRQKERQEQQQVHERIKRLCIRALTVFKEIDDLDRRSPVGLDNVNSFLEGFLEEVLDRIDMEEDYEKEELQPPIQQFRPLAPAQQHLNNYPAQLQQRGYDDEEMHVRPLAPSQQQQQHHGHNAYPQQQRNHAHRV